MNVDREGPVEPSEIVIREAGTRWNKNPKNADWDEIQEHMINLTPGTKTGTSEIG